MQKWEVLIVDDSPFSTAVVEGILGTIPDVGYRVANTYRTAVDIFKEYQPDIVIMDYTLDVGTGFECLDDMLKISRDFKAIMLSSQKDKNLELESKKRRVETYLQKPVEAEELVQVVEFIKDRYAKVTWVRNKVAEVAPEAVEVAMGSMLASRAVVEEVGTVAGVKHAGKNVVYIW